MPKGRILAIDDEAFFRRYYSDLLGEEGYQVRVAKGGRQGLEMLRQEDFDLVIIDMEMAGMDGIEVAKAVRRFNPEQEVMVVTARDEVGMAVEAMKHGVAEYLLKPLNPEEFLLVINRMMFRLSLGREHQRLMQENIEFASILGYYQKCLGLLQIQELDRLCDLILDTEMELLVAEGGLLWLAAYGGRSYRLRARRGLAEPTADEDDWLPDVMQRQQLSQGGAVLDAQGRMLWLPLLTDGDLLAVLRIETPTGRERFNRRDQKLATVIGDFAACALTNVLALRKVENESLRVPRSDAYRMGFFQDHVVRELHKAKRYGRQLSIIKMQIENYPQLSGRFHDRVLEECCRRMVSTVNTVLRDADVMGQPEPGEFFILLPETDYWGSLVLQRRIRRALDGQLSICDLKKSYPIDLLLRSASFPVDGDDFDSLEQTVLSRLDRLRGSLFHRRKLEKKGFWQILDLLLGQPEDFRADGHQLRVAPRLAAFESSPLSRYFRMPRERFAGILRAFCREVVESHRVRGIIYLSCAEFATARRNLPYLRELEATATSVYLLGGDRRVNWDLHNIMPIFIEDERFSQTDFLLYLNEDYAYALFGQQRGDSLIGFHSADFYFVENLIAKLQEQYQLQPKI